MLRIFGGSARDCDGVTRRSFLQAGVLGLGGLALPELLRLRARGGGGTGGPDRSVILFWLSGGPGHMETWDPKPDAPGEFRGPFGAIPTSVPGVQFGELLPEQAQADGQARGPPDGQPRHRRPHQGQPLDAHRLRRAGLQRPRQHRSSGGRRWARRWPGSRGPSRPGLPPTSPCRTCAAGPTTSSTTRPTSAARPTRSSSSPTRTTRSSGSGTSTLPGGLTLDRLEDRRRDARGDGRPAPRRRPEARATSTPTTQRAFDMLTGQAVAAAFDIAAEPAAAPRPLRPAHLRPERPAGPPAGRGRRHRS